MEASQKIVLFFSESSNVKKHKNKQEFAKLFFLRITELKTKPKCKNVEFPIHVKNIDINKNGQDTTKQGEAIIFILSPQVRAKNVYKEKKKKQKRTN